MIKKFIFLIFENVYVFISFSEAQIWSLQLFLGKF
jgi:hypothetical protein